MGETETNFSTKDFKSLSPAIDNYTERQYNNYGWIAVNNVMSYEEYGSLMHQFDDFKNRKYQYPVTKNGEALIITYDGNHNATKIVAIKGTTANPIITLVIKPVYGGYFDEYYLEVIRQNEALFKNITALRVLEGEELFTIKSKQNYSSFSELKRQRRSFEKSGRDSESFLYGNGSGSEDTESEYLNNEPSSNDGGFSMPKFSTKDSNDKEPSSVLSDWKYWNVILQDKNNAVWQATLNVANTKNGEKILYDINPIRKAVRSIKLDALTAYENITTLPDESQVSKSTKDNPQNQQKIIRQMLQYIGNIFHKAMTFDLL